MGSPCVSESGNTSSTPVKNLWRGTALREFTPLCPYTHTHTHTHSQATQMMLGSSLEVTKASWALKENLETLTQLPQCRIQYIFFNSLINFDGRFEFDSWFCVIFRLLLLLLFSVLHVMDWLPVKNVPCALHVMHAGTGCSHHGSWWQWANEWKCNEWKGGSVILRLHLHMCQRRHA